MKPGRRGLVVATTVSALGCGPAVATGGNGEESSSSSATLGPDSTSFGSTTSIATSTDTAAPTSTPQTGASKSTADGTTAGTVGDSSTSSTIIFDHPLPILSCSVWEDECPDGEKCTAWSRSESGVWDDARCSPVGPDQVGETCTVEGEPTSGIDSCAKGSMCWNVDPNTNVGVCAENCVGSQNAPFCNDPTTACVVGNQGSINLCSTICDPLTQNCPGDQACYGTTPDLRLVCLRPNTPLISPPDGLTPALCPPGSTAIASDLDVSCEDDALCCVSWCDLSLEDPCPLGQECYPWDEHSLWPMDVGICHSPPP